MRTIAFAVGLLPFAVTPLLGCGAPEETSGAGGSPSTTSVAGGGTGGAASTGGTASTTTGGAGGTTSTTTVEPNPDLVSVSALSFFESETSIAATPDGVVAVAFIAIKQGGSTSIGVAFSTDGGATFGPASEVVSPGLPRSSDPSLAVDSKHNFYLTWIGFQTDATGNPSDMHVYAAEAPAGTQAFGQPVEVSEPASPDQQYDKPWVAVTAQDTVLVTYAKLEGGIVVGRSTDQGATWANALAVPDGDYHNLAYPCPSAGGRVYVVYLDGTFAVNLRYSDDDGATFAGATELLVSDPAETAAFEDPTCAADGQGVWVSYGLSKDMNATELPLLDQVRIAHSADGQTIDARHTVADSAASKLFFLPQLARDGEGTLHLVYYTGDMEKDPNGSFRRTRSMDGGATWEASTSVRDPILFTGTRDEPTWLGDYVGLTAASGTLHASYADNTGGLSHVAAFHAAPP